MHFLHLLFKVKYCSVHLQIPHESAWSSKVLFVLIMLYVETVNLFSLSLPEVGRGFYEIEKN